MINSIQQLISATSRFDGPYFIILQHSLGFSQRHAVDVDGDIYKRANVRTPSENAYRDSMGSAWLEYMVECFQATSANVVWVQTNHTIDMSRFKGISVVSVANNPYGWDTAEGLTLENLDDLLSSIVAQASGKVQSPVVFESLTPILVRHGLERTTLFLQKLLTNLRSTVLTPILMESLSDVQHRRLEDMAQATIYLHGGEMTLIRQGVRERGNTVREIIPFAVDDSSGKPNILVLHAHGGDINDADGAHQSPVISENPAEILSSSVVRPGKMTLQMEGDGEKAATATLPVVKKPNFFIEDDDPEYDDLDEEDPDDDLDI